MIDRILVLKKKERFGFVKLLLLLCLLLPFDLFAFHIIGGEIYYECLGDGMYRFTLRIYRDCRTQDMRVGDLDDPAPIAIYARGNQLIHVLGAPLVERRIIEPPDYPCLIPPDNLCVEEGVYQWTYTFEDWPASHDYTIVYQRCCRNNTIININQPQLSGATYAIDITQASQRVCNSSPIFESFPPTVVCVDNDINFNHAAVDADGDSLVYSFCVPQKGGSFQSQGSAPCEGPSPNPPCPPPFDLVSFASPYRFDQPMAGDPVVKIDAQSGLISGEPQVIGQFVVGVCVKEYRNGELLSEIKRDFQFNVADCDPTVFAKVKSDATIGARSYVINSCGNNTVLFENESVLERYIQAYRWEFDIRGVKETLTSRDAEVTFPGLGTYRGTMMVNPGLECGDTAEIFVNLYPAIEADFTLAYDTCSIGPTVFRDLSVTGAERLERWEWDFGEGGASDQQHPSYTYQNAGEHVISLTVTDNNQCQDTRIIPLAYYPVPERIVVQPSQFLGCVPANVLFDNLSPLVDSSYDIRWDFGEGSTSNLVSPVHEYRAPGRFGVSVEIVSPTGCQVSADWRDWIEVRPSPTAAFTFDPEEPSNFNPEVYFTNLSRDHARQQWIFDIEGRSLAPDPVFVFPDTGVYQVALIAIHENGCVDTTWREIRVLPRVTYHMPNAFTPNQDGKNDLFIGSGYTDGMKEFQMTIWDRWGTKVYQTEDPHAAWNGSMHNAGSVLQAGVYVYQVKYVDPQGELIELQGFATLIL